jgi:hypothetical protein
MLHKAPLTLYRAAQIGGRNPGIGQQTQPPLAGIREGTIAG